MVGVELSSFLSKFGIVLIVGTVQALVVDAILLLGLGLEVQSVSRFILFSLLTSLTFIAIILLILQLTASAGTFPVELLPGLDAGPACLPADELHGIRLQGISSGD